MGAPFVAAERVSAPAAPPRKRTKVRRHRLGYDARMRIVVVGATGNVGTSLLTALAGDPAVDSILGVARRSPELQVPKTEWAQADIRSDDLVPLFRGADAVVHLAWMIQPSHDLSVL